MITEFFSCYAALYQVMTTTSVHFQMHGLRGKCLQFSINYFISLLISLLCLHAMHCFDLNWCYILHLQD